MDDDKHFPPGAEPAKAVEEPAEPEAPKVDEPKPEEAEPEKPKGDEPKPEDKKPEAPKPDEPPAPTLKKRSIYDDLKDTRKDLKDAKKRIEELEGKPADKPEDAPAPKAEKPADKPAPADELEAFAQENELDAKSLNRLAEIITKRVPQAQLSDEDKQALADLKTFRTDRAREQEDQEILSQSAVVKKQLDIHDEAELQNVMREVVKLAHTEQFHDKELEYILWKNQDALSKLVSPKKPSFESGGGRAEADPDAKPDFAKGGVTPTQVADALAPSKATYEVSSSR
jgi:hypothetical protein